MNRIVMVALLLALLTAGGWWFYTQGGVAAREEIKQAQLEAIENLAKQYKQKEAKANELRDRSLIAERQSLDRAKRLERELRLAQANQKNKEMVSGDPCTCVINDDVVRVLDEAVRDPALPERTDPEGIVAADATVTSDTISEARFLAVEAYNKCARRVNAIVEHVKSQE